MNQKYEFTGETMRHFGRTLHRIKALENFGDVKKGDLGGWIESEDNLSASGNAWVSDDAKVFDNAWVFGDAWISDDAQVSGDARVSGQYDYISIGSIGRRGDTTTFFRLKQGGIGVKCGCFIGKIDEFEKAVHKTHAGNEHEKAYMAAIRMAKEVVIHD